MFLHPHSSIAANPATPASAPLPTTTLAPAPVNGGGGGIGAPVPVGTGTVELPGIGKVPVPVGKVPVPVGEVSVTVNVGVYVGYVTAGALDCVYGGSDATVGSGSGELPVVAGGEVPKSAGSSTPLSAAQVWGSTPSGQQRPSIRQKDWEGQGSGWRRRVSLYYSLLSGSEERKGDEHTVVATGTACLADAGVVADFAAEDVACAKGVLAGVAGTEACGRGEGLVLANTELARDDDTQAIGRERGARESKSKETIHLANGIRKRT